MVFIEMQVEDKGLKPSYSLLGSDQFSLEKHLYFHNLCIL